MLTLELVYSALAAAEHIKLLAGETIQLAEGRDDLLAVG